MTTPLLQLKNASFFANKRKDAIIKPLCLSVYEGDFIVLLGSNGSGKSSLMKMIDGRYPITGGSILFKQKDLSKLAKKKRAQVIRTIGQSAKDNLFYGMTLYEHARLFLRHVPLTCKPTPHFLQNYLASIYPQLGDKIHAPVDVLSGGEQQIFILGLTLLQQPSIILLDEHTAAMDPKMTEAMMALTAKNIKRHTMTCLMTTHDLDYACQYGNRLIALDEGQVIVNLDQEAKKNISRAELIKRCYER